MEDQQFADEIKKKIDDSAQRRKREHDLSEKEREAHTSMLRRRQQELQQELQAKLLEKAREEEQRRV